MYQKNCYGGPAQHGLQHGPENDPLSSLSEWQAERPERLRCSWWDHSCSGQLASVERAGTCGTTMQSLRKSKRQRKRKWRSWEKEPHSEDCAAHQRTPLNKESRERFTVSEEEPGSASLAGQDAEAVQDCYSCLPERIQTHPSASFSRAS